MKAKMESTLISVRNGFITDEEREHAQTEVFERERMWIPDRDGKTNGFWSTDYCLRTKLANGRTVKVTIFVTEEGGDE